MDSVLEQLQSNPVSPYPLHTFTHTGDNAKQKEDLPGCSILAGRKHSNTSSLNILKRWRSSREEKLKPPEAKQKDSLASLSTSSINHMIRFTNYMATVITCLLPIAGIVVLSRVRTWAKVLGFIALFTAISAVGIMILTDSGTSRTEIFAATAA